MNKKYSSHYPTLKIVLAAHSGIFAINYFENGRIVLNQEWWAWALLIGAPLLAWYFDANTWLKLTSKEVVSGGQIEFRKPHRTNLHHIKDVRRVRQSWLIPHAGSYFAFYGDDGLLMYVREANYSKKTIKRFMSDLKQALPFAIFDPQYEELIGKPLEELSDFKRIPATNDGF